MFGIRKSFEEFGNKLIEWLDSDTLFAIPVNAITLTVGETYIIQGDSLVYLPIPNNFKATFTGTIGSQTGNNYSITPESEDIGLHSVNIRFKNGNKVVEKTINITVIDKVNTGSINILSIGDSIMAGSIGTNIDENLTGLNINWLGTLGDTYKHEARPGWAYVDFATNVRGNNPFFKAGVLDLPAYFADNSISVPDIVFIRLGVNDNYSEVYANSKILIDAFLAYNNKLRIIIGVPTICTSDAQMWYDTYGEASQNDFMLRMHQIEKLLIESYDNEVYNSRVDCSYEFINLNRATGYYNAPHPNDLGYSQLSTSLAPYICKNINKMFGAELTTGWNTAGLTWWNLKDVNWAADGSKIIGNNGIELAKTTPVFWSNTKLYRVVSRANVISGYYRIYDGADYTGSDICYQSKLYVKDYTPVYGNSMYIVSWSFIGDIQNLSIKEIL